MFSELHLCLKLQYSQIIQTDTSDAKLWDRHQNLK